MIQWRLCRHLLLDKEKPAAKAAGSVFRLPR
jgi:hypothetical protein